MTALFSFLACFLGRLFILGLIKHRSQMSVPSCVGLRTSIRPTTKSFPDLNEIWCVGIEVDVI